MEKLVKLVQAWVAEDAKRPANLEGFKHDWYISKDYLKPQDAWYLLLEELNRLMPVHDWHSGLIPTSGLGVNNIGGGTAANGEVAEVIVGVHYDSNSTSVKSVNTEEVCQELLELLLRAIRLDDGIPSNWQFGDPAPYGAWGVRPGFDSSYTRTGYTDARGRIPRLIAADLGI
jgi:hypothetical protein